MAEEIFRRVEKKYLLTKNKMDQLLKRIDSLIESDKYSDYTICNIYFDTDNYDLINLSIEKPIYKEKLRLRSYGIPSLDDNVFFEIKKKYKGIVGKRRIVAKLSDIYKYLENDTIPDCNKQIIKEIDYMIKYYDLKPKMFIAYDRIAYHGIEDKHFRITFDYNIRNRIHNLYLENGDYGKKLLKKNEYIMEVKNLGGLPLWFVKILSDLEIYPTSFSKYGNIYKREKKEGMI